MPTPGLNGSPKKCSFYGTTEEPYVAPLSAQNTLKISLGLLFLHFLTLLQVCNGFSPRSLSFFTVQTQTWQDTAAVFGNYPSATVANAMRKGETVNSP